MLIEGVARLAYERAQFVAPARVEHSELREPLDALAAEHGEEAGLAARHELQNQRRVLYTSQMTC